MKRAWLHALSFFTGAAARYEPRRTNGSCIRPLVSAETRQVKPGWQLPARPLCGGGNGGHEHSNDRAVVRGRTRPLEPAQLRGRRTLFRLVEDAPGSSEHRRV